MFGYDLGIDLGTSSIVISVVGKGVVLSEPAYVAYDVNKSEMLYAGKRAYYLEGREPVGVSVIQPIKSGNVSNYDLACQMVEYFMNKVLKKNIFKPRIVASVSSDSTDVERRTLISVLISAGARSVCLVEVFTRRLKLSRLILVLGRMSLLRISVTEKRIPVLPELTVW